MMARQFPRAPSDAAPLMALLARADVEALEEKRQQLIAAIKLAQPRRSIILEARLKQITSEWVRARLALRRAMR